MKSNKLTIRKFFQIDSEDLAVMIGAGFFFGAVYSCVISAFVGHNQSQPMANAIVATIGLIAGRILSHHARSKRDV